MYINIEELLHIQESNSLEIKAYITMRKKWHVLNLTSWLRRSTKIGPLEGFLLLTTSYVYHVAKGEYAYNLLSISLRNIIQCDFAVSMEHVWYTHNKIETANGLSHNLARHIYSFSVYSATDEAFRIWKHWNFKPIGSCSKQISW